MKKTAIILIAALIPLCACAPSYNEYGFESMGTYITVETKSDTILFEYVKSVFDELSRLFSDTEGSDVYRINVGGTEKISVNPVTAKLLSLCQMLYIETKGAFNPAVYSIAKKYRLTPLYLSYNGCVVDVPDIDASACDINFGEFIVGEDYVIKPSADFEIDLGGIAKGYALDIIAEYIEKENINYVRINAGSSSQYFKGVNIKTGKPWRIGLMNGDGYSAVAEISEGFLTSSGNYLRYYFGSDGKRYCHIISPFTRAPYSNGVVSVSVIGCGAALADAYSTAIAVLGAKDGEAFAREKGLQVYMSLYGGKYIAVDFEGKVSGEEYEGEELITEIADVSLAEVLSWD